MMKTKIILFLLLISLVNANDSCTRPYNRIGNLCCPDYNNDMICDLHETSTTIPQFLVINDTHIIDTKTDAIIKPTKAQINSIINQTSAPILIKTPIIHSTTTTINIKTESKPTITTIITTTTQKTYDTSRITELPQNSTNIYDEYKYYIGISILIIICIFIAILYIIGNDE